MILLVFCMIFWLGVAKNVFCADLEPEDDDVIHKAVRDVYLLDQENRRLSNLFLPKKLDRYLSKWVGNGIYGAIFDNITDSLLLSRVHEDSISVSDGSVLSLLWWKDERQLIQIDNEIEARGAWRSDFRREE